MKRGEVWWVNFDPSVSGETRTRHPAVIVSNDASNKHLNRVQVVPLTSSVGRVYPSEAAVVSKQRLINCSGRLTDVEMRRIEQAIKVQLDLR